MRMRQLTVKRGRKANRFPSPYPVHREDTAAPPTWGTPQWTWWRWCSLWRSRRHALRSGPPPTSPGRSENPGGTMLDQAESNRTNNTHRKRPMKYQTPWESCFKTNATRALERTGLGKILGVATPKCESLSQTEFPLHFRCRPQFWAQPASLPVSWFLSTL